MIEILNTVSNEIIPLVLRIITVVAAALFTKIVIPWLKEQRLYESIIKYVQAAEKLGESGAISKERKKEYVLSVLKASGITVDHSVDTLIEAAVEEIGCLKGEIVNEFAEPADKKEEK